MCFVVIFGSGSACAARGRGCAKAVLVMISIANPSARVGEGKNGRPPSCSVQDCVRLASVLQALALEDPSKKGDLTNFDAR